jgi:Leucine-rich repeat (LRR) protein
MPHLQILNLSANRIRTPFPAEFFMMLELRDLNLSGNRIPSVQTTALFAQPAPLRVLDLSQNLFTTLPEFVVQMHSLTTLRLAGNRLTMLRLTTPLPLLATLDLSDNAFTALPHLEPVLVPALSALSVARNQISLLPATVFALPALGILDVSGNQLATIPDGLSNATRLRELNFADNALSELPDELCRLSVLKSLNVAGNKRYATELICFSVLF